MERLDPGMVAILSSKSGAERLAMAVGMFGAARRMLESQLRFQNPGWNEDELAADVARRIAARERNGTG